jgi:hypothetical protein
MWKSRYVIAALAFVWIGGVSPRAIALPTVEQDTYYFSDPDYETQVGEEVLECNRGHFLSGQRTQYMIRILLDCNIPPRFPVTQECLECDAVDPWGTPQHCLLVPCPADPFLTPQ